VIFNAVIQSLTTC